MICSARRLAELNVGVTVHLRLYPAPCRLLAAWWHHKDLLLLLLLLLEIEDPCQT
jgi:hypothetical protein